MSIFKTVFLFVFCFNIAFANSNQLQDVIYASNRVGSALANAVNLTQPMDNMMISPISLQMALGMLANGSQGKSLAILGNAFYGKQKNTSALLNSTSNSSRQLIDYINQSPRNSSDSDNAPVTFLTSNSAWSSNNPENPFPFSDKFIKSLQTGYLAEVYTKDFMNPATAELANDWVDRKTHGLIPQIVTPNDLENNNFMLINASFFEGKWEKPFEVSENVLPKFTTLSRTALTNPEAMSSHDTFRHWQDNEREVIALPYINNNKKQYSMIIVLPDQRLNFKTWLLNFKGAWNSPVYWKNILNKTKAQEPGMGTIVVPKFAFDYEVNLKKGDGLTNKLGFSYLFDDHPSDLAPMSALPLVKAKLSLIKQKTRIEFDEKGTKAAAATVVIGAGETESASVEEPEPEFYMEVNRPFTFAIVEEKSGALLFIGQVTDPSQK